jgi:hypothetical protein
VAFGNIGTPYVLFFFENKPTLDNIAFFDPTGIVVSSSSLVGDTAATSRPIGIRSASTRTWEEASVDNDDPDCALRS